MNDLVISVFYQIGRAGSWQETLRCTVDSIDLTNEEYPHILATDVYLKENSTKVFFEMRLSFFFRTVDFKGPKAVHLTHMNICIFSSSTKKELTNHETQGNVSVCAQETEPNLAEDASTENRFDLVLQCVFFFG